MKYLLVLPFLLSGCTSFQSSDSTIGNESSKSFTLVESTDVNKTETEKQIENQKNIEKGLESVLTFCQPRLSGYESKTASQAKQAYWLSMSGLIAGSIISPALIAANASANAATIVAFSGWAGATNFAGQALATSGLSGSTIAKTRNDIITEVKLRIEEATDTNNDFNIRRNALLKARSACLIYEISVPSIPATN